MKMGNLLVPLSLHLDLVCKTKVIAQKMKPRVSMFIFQKSWYDCNPLLFIHISENQKNDPGMK